MCLIINTCEYSVLNGSELERGFINNIIRVSNAITEVI